MTLIGPATTGPTQSGADPEDVSIHWQHAKTERVHHDAFGDFIGYPCQFNQIILRCRVAIKAGKSCANKTGMGLEDWAMEEDEGFGIEIGCMAEVVEVAIGTQAADDDGPGWGVNGVTL